MQMRAELIRECPELEGQIPGQNLASGVRVTLKNGLLTSWTAELEIDEMVPIGSPLGARLLDARQDLSACLFSDDGDTYLWVRGQLFSVALNARAGAILGDGRVVAVHADSPPGVASADSFQLVLLDAQARILASEAFEADQAGVFAVAHPHGQLVILEFPMGQDGILVVSAQAKQDELELSELLPGDEAIPAGFSPDGKRVLLLPYPNDPETVRIAAWPAMEVVGQLNAQDVEVDGEPAEQGFDISGGWLSDSSVLILATELGPVIASENLNEVSPVEMLSAQEVIADGMVETVHPLGPNHFAATIWRPKMPRLTTVWRLLSD